MVFSEAVYDTMFNKIRDFRENKNFCDVEFLVQHQIFPAHKVILAASSEYFQAMLLGGMQERSLSAITLRQLTSDVFAILLDFIYGAGLRIEQQNVEDVIVTADMLQINSAVELCEVYMSEQLATNNCIGFYCFAKQHSFSKLQKAAWSFILKNFTHVIKEKEFRSVPFEVLVDFTSSEDIAVKSETDVLQCVIDWISCNPRERRGKCVSLLKNVRKRLISPHDIDKILVSIKDLCLKIAMKVLTSEVRKCDIVLEETCHPRLSARKSFYMIGGCTATHSQMNGFDIVSYVERYDSFSKRWDRYPLSLRKARTRVSAVVVDRKIYIIGGEDDTMIYGSIECYDTILKSWKNELLSTAIPRSSFQAVSHGSSIYIIGGDVGSGAGKSIEVYNTTTDQCRLVTFEMQTGRHSFGATRYDDILYMAGGVDLSECELRTMECYDLKNHDWWFAKDMLVKRMNFSLVCCGSFLYAVGGHNQDSGTLNSVEKYDIYRNVWTPCAPIKYARAGAFTSVMDSKIIAVGGKRQISDHRQNSWQILNCSEVYDIEKDVWTECQELEAGMRCDGAALVF